MALLARREEALVEIAKELPGSLVAPADLRDEQSIRDAFARVKTEWGGVDVLINNAGLGHAMPLPEADAEQMREMMDVNVIGLCLCTREAIQDMQTRDEGHVIHVSSLSAHRVPAKIGGAFYAATKHAVKALTEGLRQELRAAESRVRISSVSPGFVETEFAERYYQDPNKAAELYASFKSLDADDVAESIVYVLSAPEHAEVHDLLLRPREQLS